MAKDHSVTTCFTTLDGIVAFRMDQNDVVITFRGDNGETFELPMPAWKFNWAVKDFRSYVLKADT